MQPGSDLPKEEGEIIDTTKLQVFKKFVRPIEKQSDLESR